LGFFFTKLISSSPLMSGMLMSVMIRSKRCRGRSFRASKPLPVQTTSAPSICRTVVAMNSADALESSTMRTLNPIPRPGLAD